MNNRELIEALRRAEGSETLRSVYLGNQNAEQRCKQAADALSRYQWRTDMENAPSYEAYTEFDYYLVTVQSDIDQNKKHVKTGAFLEDGFYFEDGAEIHPNWTPVAWMPMPTPHKESE